MLKVENLCHAAGCARTNGRYPSCCHDSALLNLTGEDLMRSFPNAIYDPWLDVSNPNSKSQGTYFTERTPVADNGPYNLLIVGPCPNLDHSGNCTAKIKPGPCLTEKRGGNICTFYRNRDGLPQVDSKFKE